MTESELSNAAFWDQLICLDCEKIIPPEDPVIQREGLCPACGSDAVYSAVFIKRVSEWLTSE